MRDRLRPSRNEGFVLVVVICMVMAMTGLVLAFHSRARASVRTADSLRKSVQALCCARSGLGLAAAVIRSGGASVEYKTSIDLGDGSCRMELSDEQGKLNLNQLTDPNGRPDRTRIDQVLRLIDLTHRDDAGGPIGYGIVPAIIDWIDEDDRTTCLDFIERQNTGAESDYYLGREPPYRCANRPLETPEELLYVTVYGDGRININTAPRRVIESLCEQMDPALTQGIVDRRRVRPFRSLEEVRQVPGMTAVVYDRIHRLITVESAGLYYRLQAYGQVDNLSRTVSAILRKNTGDGTVDIVGYREDRSQESGVRSQKE
jgi:general secretion pathway protein K